MNQICQLRLSQAHELAMVLYQAIAVCIWWSCRILLPYRTFNPSNIWTTVGESYKMALGKPNFLANGKSVDIRSLGPKVR